MKTSALGKRTASTPTYAQKGSAKKNKSHKGQGKGTVPKKKYPSTPPTLTTAINKNLAGLNPAMKASARKKMGRASKGMIRETTGRYNLTTP